MKILIVNKLCIHYPIFIVKLLVNIFKLSLKKIHDFGNAKIK